MKEVNLAIFKPAVDTFTSENSIRNTLLLIYFLKKMKEWKTSINWYNMEQFCFKPICSSLPFSSGFDKYHISSRFFIFYKVYRNHLFKLQTTIKCMEMKMLLSLMHDAIRGIKTHSY